MVPSEQDASQMTYTNKDLLRFEHLSSSSIIPGARLRSLCRAAHPSATAEVSRLPLVESSVLDRVKAFLPILEEANKKLKTDIKDKGEDEFNIEVLSKNEQASYVEMDLALGVADLQTPDAVQAAERLVGQAACRELDIDSESEISIVNGHKDDDGILQDGTRKRPKIEQLKVCKIIQYHFAWKLSMRGDSFVLSSHYGFKCNASEIGLMELSSLVLY